MKKLFKTALKINELAVNTATNAADWFFRKEILIQSGKTEYEVIAEHLPMRVRYYAPMAASPNASLAEGETETPTNRQHAVPLVLVPPLGVTTETFDLMPDRSLVKAMVEAGFRVYLVDWGKPERKDGHLGLFDYSHTMMGQALDAVREHSQSKRSDARKRTHPQRHLPIPRPCRQDHRNDLQIFCHLFRPRPDGHGHHVDCQHCGPHLFQQPHRG